MAEEIPFPNGYLNRGIENNLFKHVLFQTDKNISDFRIKAIGHDWTELKEVQNSKISIPLKSWNLAKDKVRVKAVLNTPYYGVSESDWVSQRILGKVKKRKMNQFRIRGVSDKNIRSRWTYSEIKGEDNDLVVFQLLHDVLDAMTMLHEHELTALIDVGVVDMLIGMMNGGMQDDVNWVETLQLKNEEFKYGLVEEIKTNGVTSELLSFFKRAGMSETIYHEFMQDYFKYKESKKSKINEAVELLSKYFKKNILEQKKFSASDIMVHAKTWEIKEDYISEVLDDMLTHIFTISVEDAYEKAIEQASLVALLQGDEEILTLLNDAYEFEAESAINDIFVHTAFVEDFVSYFSDGLKLLIEPHFNEATMANVIEEAVPTLLLLYKEVFIPLQKLDEATLDLFNDLKDDATGIYQEVSTSKQGLQISYFDEDSGDTWTEYQAYLTEMFEYLLLTDDHMEKHFDTILYSVASNAFKKDSLKALIIYDPVEAIEYIAQLAENVNTSFSIWNDIVSEKSNLQLRESLSTQIKNKSGVNETQTLKKEEGLVFSNTLFKKNIEELSAIFTKEDYVIDLEKFREILENYKFLFSEGYQLQDILSNKDLFADYNLKVTEALGSKSATHKFALDISSYITLIHHLLLTNLTGELDEAYIVPAYAHEHLELLYSLNMEDKFIGPFMRRETSEEEEIPEMFPIFYRYDDYFNVMWNLREDIHVHLGELDLTGGRFPVGYFVLGNNTLEGEKN